LPRQVRIEVSEGVNISGLNDFIYPGAFFGQKAGGLLILFGPSQVNLAVRGIDIAAEHNRLPLFSQLFALL
jgi:hypothetical protein